MPPELYSLPAFPAGTWPSPSPPPQLRKKKNNRVVVNIFRTPHAAAMPKEHKKRGRREDQKKRKRDHDDPDAASKRRKNHVDDAPVATPESVPFQDEAIDDVTRPGAMPFYGMLDDDEQEYFKRADEMLELNHFDTPEERTMFLESVYKEAEGKELKLANSQSCSRLMERLILLSTPKQLKNLFQKFNDE